VLVGVRPPGYQTTCRAPLEILGGGIAERKITISNGAGFNAEGLKEFTPK